MGMLWDRAKLVGEEKCEIALKGAKQKGHLQVFELIGKAKVRYAMQAVPPNEVFK